MDRKFQDALAIILLTQAKIKPEQLDFAIELAIAEADNKPILISDGKKSVTVDTKKRRVDLKCPTSAKSYCATPFNITFIGSGNGQEVRILNHCTVYNEAGHQIVCDIPETFTKQNGAVTSEKHEKSLFFNDEPPKNPPPMLTGIVNQTIEKGSSAANSMVRMIAASGWKGTEYIAVAQSLIRKGDCKKIFQGGLEMEIKMTTDDSLLIRINKDGGRLVEITSIGITSQRVSGVTMECHIETGDHVTRTRKGYSTEAIVPYVLYTKDEIVIPKPKIAIQHTDPIDPIKQF